MIVRIELLCAAASRLMLCSTSRRDATADNLSAILLHMHTHFVTVVRTSVYALKLNVTEQASSGRLQQAVAKAAPLM